MKEPHSWVHICSKCFDLWQSARLFFELSICRVAVARHIMCAILLCVSLRLIEPSSCIATHRTSDIHIGSTRTRGRKLCRLWATIRLQHIYFTCTTSTTQVFYICCGRFLLIWHKSRRAEVEPSSCAYVGTVDSIMYTHCARYSYLETWPINTNAGREGHVSR